MPKQTLAMHYMDILSELNNIVGEQLGFWHCGYHPWSSWGWAATNAHTSSQNAPWAQNSATANCELFPETPHFVSWPENLKAINHIKQKVSRLRPADHHQYV